MGKANAAAHLADYKWQPGVSPNPAGRPKGSRSKLQEAVIRALHEDFEQYGVEAIRRVRERRPEVYLTACVSLLPKQAEKIQSPFADISDAEIEALEAHLATVRAKLVRDIDATASVHNGQEGVMDAVQHALDLSPDMPGSPRAEHIVDQSTLPDDAA